VVALGGGALTSRLVRHLVRRSGHLIWLRAEPAVLARRLSNDRARPLLQGDAAERLAQQAAEREPVFARMADAVVDVAPLSAVEAAALVASAVSVLEAQRPHAG
jgi:shikimate kinase